MNKIYKVIWSKVRNCYVAVSEIAKRNGKSCTSVNCGAKANRGRVGAVLAIALSLSMTGGGVAWGSTPVSTTPYIVSSSSYNETEFELVTGSSVFTVSETGSIKGVYSAGSNKTITIKAGGSVAGHYLNGCSIIAGVSGNTVDVYGTVEYRIWGGTVNTGPDYASAPNSSTNNTVNIYTGAVVNGRIYGSYAVPEGASSQGTVNINGGTVTDDVKGAVGGLANTNATGTVNVKGGTVTGAIYGADTYDGGSNAIGTVNISGGTVENYVYGAYGWDPGTNAKGVVKVSGGTVKRNIYGSYGTSGANATGGTVTVTKTDLYDSANGIIIYGGYASNNGGNATGNTVKLSERNAEIKTGISYVYGGYVYDSNGNNNVNATGNTVELEGYTSYSTPSTRIYGGGCSSGSTGDLVTGNKLILSNRGNIVSFVKNFETIKITDGVAWEPGKAVIEAGSYGNDNGAPMILDITSSTDVTKPVFYQATDHGSMNLLKVLVSTGRDSFDNFKIKYNNNQPVALSSKMVVKAGTSKTSADKGVTIGYNQNEHTVSLDKSSPNFPSITYTIDDNATSISLGTMIWGTGRDLTNGQFNFDSNTTITASSLAFSNKATTALKTDGTSTMALLTNATGLSSSNTVTGGTNRTLGVEYNDGIIKFDATAKGDVTADTDKVKFTVKSVAADKLTLGSFAWGGAADAMPTSWSTSSATTVDASNLTFTGSVNSNPINTSKTLITGVSGIAANKITQPTGTGKGELTVSGYNDGKGVTFNGKGKGTVSVSSSNLIYTINSVAADKLTLGSFAWGTNDTMPTGWTASGSTSINAASFAYTGAATEQLKKNDTHVILNAQGLTAGSVTSGDNKTVGMNYSDSTSGIGFAGTVNGHVEKAENIVNYVVDGATLDSINLTNWNGATFDLKASTWGWQLAKNDSNVVTATVEAEGMTGPTGLADGEKKVIITVTGTNGTDYFAGITINGLAWAEGSSINEDLVEGGVTIAGTQTTGGIKVNEANQNQLVYEATKKKVTSITLGQVEFAANGIARTFGNMYDVSTATINADGLTFTNTGKMEAGDTITIVNAENAISNSITGQKISNFEEKTYNPIAYKDTVYLNSATNSKITFVGTHTDTLAQSTDTAKSKLIYTVGDKMVTSTTLSGPITWSETGAYYTNGTALNQENRNSVFTFNNSSTIDISGAQFRASTDPLNKTMTLISGNTINSVAKNVAGTVSNGTPASFDVSFGRANATLAANASGTAEITASGNLTYTVNGVAIDKINVTSIENDADTVPTGWTLAKDNSDKVIAKVETDGLVVASPSGLEPGETKVIIEAATGSAGFFKDVAVNGSHAWKVDGSTITSDLDIGGVAITGTQTKGGVKVNEANTNQIIYEESKKKINTLTLGSVTFANDDGTAATVARTFDKTYDVSTATISTDDLDFANSDIMETGNSMRIVDASAAIPNAISNKKLPAFTEQTKKVAFTDTITGKNLTLKGAHTDTLSQDAAQTTLTYTVGDKVVSSATLAGDITWSDGGTHYTNGSDANQNGTKATYTFDGSSAVDISGATFSATSDPLAGSTKSMTLLKGVTGVVATKVSGTPSFAVTLDQTNTKLDAKATGASGVSGNDVTFTVSGVTLDKITVKSANGTADKVPASWTMAAGATIETDSMTVPELAAGTHVDILQSDTDGFFAKVAINGANAYGNTQETFTESDAAKSVSIAGTQDKGVTLNTEKKHLIYKAGTLDVASVTLGLVEWKKGATVFDRSGAGYNYAGVAALGTDGFAISYASPETVATGDSMTLLQANATLKDMAEQVKKTSYSYTPVTGVTIDANITGKLATSGGAVTYTAAANQAGKLTFTNVDWKDSGALMTRPKNITFSGADVDTAKIHFQNVKELDANRKMTLVSDFGDSVGTITGSKYTVGAGLEGEGAASLSGSDLVFTTKTGARDLAAQKQTHNTLMVMEAGMAVLAAGREHLGQAMVGLADPQNAGSDGTRIGASMGGGWSRYKTGSHVDSNNWNVAAAVGSKRELKRGSLEWGVFGEYGKSNYTLHSDAGRGDGDSHYAGGGLMAKWTNKHDVYTEASVRLGRLSDSASNLLRDAAGNGYGYDVHANYFGAHVGIGKIIHYKGGKSLDVYGKYFYTKRDGVDFASGGNNYSLDSVASSILRVGARYGTTDKKWNWYGGLAYEYEFDGKSEGTVDGIGIRAASVKGGSVRGEIGLRMSATKTNPWQTDISIYGYGGKHRGFGGSVNVAYMF